MTYEGRLNAHLPSATRLLMVKADGSVLVHSDGGSYKPLNWMSPPATLHVEEPSEEQAAQGVVAVWRVQAKKSDDRLLVLLEEVLSDVSHELGVDPGLVKDGVEAHLQELLAARGFSRFSDAVGHAHRAEPHPVDPIDGDEPVDDAHVLEAGTQG